MTSPPLSTKIVFLVTIIIYVVHLVLNALAGSAKSGDLLFPTSVGDQSDRYKLELTPVGATFSIWGAIFIYQLVWMIYIATTMFRNGTACNILSLKFYIVFMVNIFFVVAWLFTFSRSQINVSLVMLVITQIAFDATLVIAVLDLKHFLDDNKMSTENRIDIWCQRMMVQNGLLFYGTWTTIATVLNCGIVMAYSLGADTITSSIISLCILGALVVTWFVLESFVFDKYTEYTFTAYITFMIGLTGTTAGSWNKDKRVGGLALGLAILSALLFITRIIIIVVRHQRSLNMVAISVEEVKKINLLWKTEETLK